MFRDRVVSLEQTLEIGEKHLAVLIDLVRDVLPGFEYVSHELEHERDLFAVTFRRAEGGESRTLLLTRMVLSDTTCLPALSEGPEAPVRQKLLDQVAALAHRPEVLVTFRSVMSDEDRALADEIDGEWRRQQEALAAARRAEEERRAEERRRQQKQRREVDVRNRQRRMPEPGRQQAPREGVPAGEAAQAPGAGGRRRRRGRGGRPGGGPGARPAPVPGVAQQGLAPAPRPAQPRPVQPSQPGAPPRADGGERGPVPAQAHREEGGRRRRRRGRGGRGGGPRPGGGAPPAGAPQA